MPKIKMRKPCVCGHTEGSITESGLQDVVRCDRCGKFQYNAPRKELGKPRRSVTKREPIPASKRARILMRAGGACEICHCSDSPLTVGHILSVDAGTRAGLDDYTINSDENLAAMCEACNSGIGAEPVPLRIAAAIVFSRSKGTKNGTQGASSELV
jgi:hypothetical protein